MSRFAGPPSNITAMARIIETIGTTDPEAKRRTNAFRARTCGPKIEVLRDNETSTTDAKVPASAQIGGVAESDATIQINVVWVTSIRANGRPLIAETRLVEGVSRGFAHTRTRTATPEAQEFVSAPFQVT